MRRAAATVHKQIRILPMAFLAGNLLSVAAYASSSLVVPTQFPTIQSAVDSASPGDTIKVLPGTYTGEVRMVKDLVLRGSGATVTNIQAPPSLVPFAQDLDGLPLTAIVHITDGAHVVMTGFTVMGPVSGVCDTVRRYRKLQRVSGIRVTNGGTLELFDSRVTRIREEPLGLCDSGNGIVIGLRPSTVPGGSIGHATIRDVTVDDYQHDGIGVSAAGSTGELSLNTVMGQGPSAVFPQNGIVVLDGAAARVTENLISGHACVIPGFCGPDLLNQIQSNGIVALAQGSGTVISENRVFDNDGGIIVLSSSNSCVVRENELTNNGVYGAALVDGNFTTFENVIAGGRIGIVVAATSVDTLAILHADEISATTVAPVQEVSCCGFTAKAIVDAK